MLPEECYANQCKCKKYDYQSLERIRRIAEGVLMSGGALAGLRMLAVIVFSFIPEGTFYRQQLWFKMQICK